MPEDAPPISVRPFREADWTFIWPIIRDVTARGETYVYSRSLDETSARQLWLGQSGSTVVVATNEEDIPIGTANMRPNYAGPGSHVANASFMVSNTHRRGGVGKALATYALSWAEAEGFSSMVFNAVVERNHQAISLWQSLGFKIVGTIPAGFAHPTHGLVGLHIMHKHLPVAPPQAI